MQYAYVWGTGMWIISSIVGFLAISDDGKILEKRIFGEKPNAENAVEGIRAIEEGRCPRELRELLESLEVREIKTDSETILHIIREKFPDIKIALVTKGAELQQVREAVNHFLVALFGDYPKYVEFANNVSLLLLKEKLREVGGEPDKMIIQAITLIEELTESINAFIAHLREWYGIVFPDLGKIIDDHRQYAEIIANIGKPENMTREALEKFVKSEKKIEEIINSLQTSLVVKITTEDETQIKNIANLILQMYELKDKMEEYLKDLMEDTCPNITALVGPTIGAKLIRKAGGLRQLALKPASTIQVLGAEKALFRALRGRGTPPKHGIIFVHPLIFKAPWWQRGKIARALATKLSIAARVDYFSKEYIGDELKNELMMRVAEIRKKYPKPPPEKVKKKKKKKPKKKKKKK